ncbi:MAG: hypothetical protein ACXAC0_07090 [Candidatus Thorarchaeota archaeon]|jgi:hypothetical protein
MSKSRSQSSLLKELEHTEVVLQGLLTTLSNLNSALKPIEHEMKVSDFASSGEFVRGASRGVVCALSGLIQGDPLQRILTEKGRGRDIPSLIKAGDRSESQMTVESIVNMLHAEDQKQRLEYVINLRWSELPAPLEKEKVVIRGSRFESGSHISMTKLERDLEEIGLKIVVDIGEFGGGPLVYEIIKSFSNRPNLLVTELTLSRQVVEDDIAVIQILKTLSSF